MSDGTDDNLDALFFGTPERPTGIGKTMSPADLADLLGAHVNTVLRWIKDGDLVAYKPTSQYVILTADAIAFMRARRSRPAVPHHEPDEPDEPDAETPDRGVPSGTSSPSLG